MPLFKISGELEKLAREVLRIQITVLGDCPQCGGSQYRSGVCEDCAYIAQEVLEAIQEWQLSQGMKPQEQGKLASREVVDAFAQIIVMAKDKSKNDNKCPRPGCGRELEHGINCRACGYERPPSELDHKSPKFTGPSPELLKNIRRKFIPSSTALEQINEQKKKQPKKKDKNKRSSFRFDNVNGSETKLSTIGNDLDNDQVASKDKVTEGLRALQEVAKMRYEQNQKENANEQGAPQ